MRTKESIKVEIRTLMTALAQSSMELRREIKSGRTMHLARLAEARHQIVLSIAHRQGLLIEILSNEIEYSTKKEAA